MKKDTISPIDPRISRLIQQTLIEIRQASPTGLNPLESALEAYRLRLQTLAPNLLMSMQKELTERIMQENDLSSRFVLKLMHDVTDAVRDGRRPAYLMTVLSP